MKTTPLTPNPILFSIILSLAVFLIPGLSAAGIGNDSYTVLLISSDNADGDTVLTDRSIGGSVHTISLSGDTHHSNDTAKMNSSSIKLDGDGDRLVIPQSQDFEFGDEDFTIDFWVNFKTIKRYGRNTQNIFFSNGIDYGWGENGFAFCYGKAPDGSGENQLFCLINGKTTNFIFSNTTNILSENTWHHIALVRSQNDFHCFVDGELKDTKSIANTYISSSTDLWIGQTYEKEHPEKDLDAYIDEFRITKGLARWTGFFTPFTTPYVGEDQAPSVSFSASKLIVVPGDAVTLNWDSANAETVSIDNDIGIVFETGSLELFPEITSTYTITAVNPHGTTTKSVTITSSYGNDSFTVLLISSDNEDDDTVFTDRSSGGETHTIIPSGDIHHEVNESVFNQSSIQFDGNGDMLSIPASPDFEFGTGNFTIDFWIKPNQIDQGVIAELGHYSTGCSIYFWKGKLRVYLANESVKYLFPSVLDTWYHVAVVRKSGIVKLYINGVAQAVYDGTESLPGSVTLTTDVQIGYGHDSEATNCYLDAYIDEFRISKGIVRWTEDFTPAKKPYSRADDPPSINFTASKSHITPGESVTLSWEVSNADEVSIDNGVGAVASTGTLEVFPQASTTYTLTATNSHGSAATSRQVVVSLGNDYSTVLLISSDNEDADTVFTDRSAGGETHMITPSGDVHHEINEQVFNQSSIQFDGSGDMLTIPASPDFEFGTGDFTIDFWIKPNLITRGVITEIDSYTTGLRIQFLEGFLYVYIAGDYVRYKFPSVFEWYHLAVVRQSGKVRLYINGADQTRNRGTGVLPGFMTCAADLRIGYYNGTNSEYHLDGYIDEFRISKGLARWTSDFDPPAQSYWELEPIAYAQTTTMADSTQLDIELKGGGASGDSLSYFIKTYPEHGELSGDPPFVTYTPSPAYTGTDSFSFSVDNGFAESAPAVVSIDIYSDGDCSSDTRTPVIILAGDAELKVAYGDVYIDPGASAMDACDGDITSDIVVDNPVDVYQLGTYTITYNVTDTSGNAAATVQRIVQVQGWVDETRVTTYEHNSSGQPVSIVTEVH